MEHREMYIKSESGREKAMGEKGRGRKRNTKKEKRRERERRGTITRCIQKGRKREGEREGNRISRHAPPQTSPWPPTTKKTKTIMNRL